MGINLREAPFSPSPSRGRTGWGWVSLSQCSKSQYPRNSFDVILKIAATRTANAANLLSGGNMRHLIKWLMHGLVLALFASSVYAQPAALHLVFVIDGLRPDSITEADTPTLYRLRREGVAFENTHSVFP
ncbi:MAG TPA: alkaline phosphatase family protein, partial [Burkholderiales bacterium]|nr:alkaline phosphatase family protein [Burkholderiales bacterium]